MSTPYIHTELVHNFSAAREVVPVVMKLVKPSSVLDVGCGTGTWLKIFAEHGVEDYAGLDGDYTDRSMLKIPTARFHPHDLSSAFDLNRKFDLVVSLEVGEHLAEPAADTFVESLIKHGEVHLFSAAIPGQGGQRHLNEQWPAYWEAKFKKYGFYFHDVVRPEIWDNNRIDFWYRQNIFLVTKEKSAKSHFPILSVVHPDLHELKLKNAKDYLESLMEGRQGLRVSFTIFLNAIKFKIKNLLRLK